MIETSKIKQACQKPADEWWVQWDDRTHLHFQHIAALGYECSSHSAVGCWASSFIYFLLEYNCFTMLLLSAVQSESAVCMYTWGRMYVYMGPLVDRPPFCSPHPSRSSQHRAELPVCYGSLPPGFKLLPRRSLLQEASPDSVRSVPPLLSAFYLGLCNSIHI